MVLCIANAMEKVFWKLSIQIIYIIYSLRKILINALSFQRIMVRLPSINDINITHKLFHKYNFQSNQGYFIVWITKDSFIQIVRRNEAF